MDRSHICFHIKLNWCVIIHIHYRQSETIVFLFIILKNHGAVSICQCQTVGPELYSQWGDERDLRSDILLCCNGERYFPGTMVSLYSV